MGLTAAQKEKIVKLGQLEKYHKNLKEQTLKPIIDNLAMLNESLLEDGNNNETLRWGNKSSYLNEEIKQSDVQAWGDSADWKCAVSW